jgi:exopolyphosphatase
MWGNVSVLSIIDHHDDRNLLRHARPRIIQVAASCSSLVSRLVLDAREKHHLSSPSPSFHGPLPIELVDLLLRTIALDSDGLDKDSSQKVDKKSAERLLAISSWKGQKLKDVMQRLGKEIKKSKKGLGELVVRDLLRRDWKGDA